MTQIATSRYASMSRDELIEALEKADAKCEELADELFLMMKLRRAPVLKPVDKDILEEFRHVEKWGKVKDASGNTRANFTTIARNLNVSPDTVKRSAARLEKLHLAEIHEHAGPQDEYERKYVHVKAEKLTTIDHLEDTEDVIPKQGGNQYQCQKCLGHHTKVHTIKLVECLDCHHISIIEDNGQMMQKLQKQLASNAFTPNARIECVEDCGQVPETMLTQHSFDHAQKQNAEHSVYTVGYDCVPAELRELGQWLVWRADPDPQTGKIKKVPYTAKPGRSSRGPCDPTDPQNWATFEQACARLEESKSYKQPYTGLGFSFKKGGGLVGIDNDASHETFVHSYAEDSYSLRGVHQIVKGTIPDNIKRGDLGIEMYDHDRFFVMTGRARPDMPATIEHDQAGIDSLYEAIKRPEAPKSQPSPCVHKTLPCDDEAIIEKARNARNGAKFVRLFDDGKWEGLYPSQSEADAALCSLFKWFVGNDRDAIDRLFRQSKLYRPKWERDDYRERTFNCALGMDDAA